VDRVLRESTRALTFTFPNSVTEASGMSSVSSRNRAAVGFHSTREPLTWYAPAVPPPGLLASWPPGHARYARRHALHLSLHHALHHAMHRARTDTLAEALRARFQASTISWVVPGIGKIIVLGFPQERHLKGSI